MARAKAKASKSARSTAKKKRKVQAAKGRSRAAPRGTAKTAKIEAVLPEPVEVLEAAVAETKCIILPETIDTSAAGKLKDDLLGLRGHAIEIDASQVRRVGAMSMQVLLAASRSWQADGKSISLARPSDEFVDAARVLGLSGQSLIANAVAA